MADAIGSVRATFTASAGGMIGAIDQIVGKLGGFAAATKRTQAQTNEYNKIVGDLGAAFLGGGKSAAQYAEEVGRVQGKFKGIGEAERMRMAIEALRMAQLAGTRDAEELAAAEAKVAAAVKAATPPIERLSLDLAKNRSDFLAGKVSIEQYRQTIATLPGQINGTESAAAKMDRIFKQSQETVRGLRSPTADLEEKLARLNEQFEAGFIDDQQYAQASSEVKAKLEAMTPEAIAAAQAAAELSAAMERGKNVTQQFLTPQEKFDANMAEMTSLLNQNAISQETFQRAAAAASEKLAKEEQSLRDATPEAKALAEAMEEGKRVTQSMLTPAEKYDQEIKKLDGLLAKGAISQDTHSRAVKKAKDEMDKAAPAAKSIGDAFGGLPGPLGAAARGFDMMQKSLGTTIAGFKSGGISGGVSAFVGQLRSGIANAGSTGGASLVGIAPQIALVAGATYAAVQGMAALANAVGEVGSRVERTGQLADRLGITFQQYEILSVAANMAGVETEALAASQTKALKAISAARDGAGAEAQAFQALGISQEMLATTSPAAIMEEAAKKIGEIEDPATRAALAVKIFGKSGNEVLPALAGINAVREGIQRLGGVMNQKDEGRFKALDDAFDNAGRASTRLGEVLLTPFTEAFAAIAEGAAATIGGFAAAFSPIGDIAADVLGLIAAPIQLIGEALGVAFRIVGVLVQAFKNGVGAIIEFVSQGTLLAPLFAGAGAVAQGLFDVIKGIGGFIGYIVSSLESLVGIKVEPMKAGSDAENIEAKMKADEDARKAAEDADKKETERAKQLADSLMTPYQKMQGELEEINALREKGKLTAEQHAQLEDKIQAAFAAQDPLVQQMKKAEEERNKAAKDITAEIEKSAKAGADLGAAADPIRDAFKSTAEEIKSQLEAGMLSPDEAKKQMGEAVDAMNEELKRLGEDQKFAEKIREGLKTEVQRVQEELDAIDKNQTLTDEEKDKAKAQVRDKFAAGLPGAAEKDAADKFREDQKKLKEAFDAGLIDKDQFKERQGRIREELDASVSDIKDRQERNSQPDRRAVGAVDVNSSEGASTFFRLLRGQDDPTKKQLDEMKKQTRLLERVAEAEAEVVKI